ncbi:HNH endonuclease signature motif containing protein [Arthrobacter castelli]|uniref:HNH endonuclease signature motif containing protein n=1 Tax=Arthrobacter castelli TaxID=271431 RepID=UPI00047900BC|nr:HNH endonuclease signature motif containing protein [Arthrobacter castelli]
MSVQDSSNDDDSFLWPEEVALGDQAAPAPISAAAPLGALDDAIDEVLNIDPAAVTDVGALEMLEQLARGRRRLEAAWLRAVAVADQLDATSVAGIPATLQQHLTAGTGSSPGRATADIAAARALHGEPTRELIRTPETDRGPLAPMGQLLAAGETSAAHVDTGVKTLEQVPDRLATEENLATVTDFLTEQAPITTPKQIKILANRLIRRLEPDTGDHYDAEAYNRRSFTMTTDITGMVHGTYQLDPAAGAELIAILSPLAAPYPEQKDENGSTIARDTRLPKQRRADAFAELIRAGATYLGPVNHASPPVAAPAAPQAAPTVGSCDGGDEGASGAERRRSMPANDGGAGSSGGAGSAGSSGGAGSAGSSTNTGQGVPQIPDLFGLDGSTAGSPDGDPAIAEGAATPVTGEWERLARQTTPTRPEKPPGSRAGKLRLSRRQNRVSIVTTMDQIRTIEDRRTGRRTAVDPTDSHCAQIESISAGTLALMSCDALFERVVLDAKGALLDLGIPVRLASPAQKRALAVRDCGCIVPGCNRPPDWCECHHIIWHTHDGPTDTGNLGLGCGTHHRAFHAGLLEATMIDGIPYVRATAKGARTTGTTFPLGSVAHRDHPSWIRNSYFDQLKSADNAAKAIVIPSYEERRSAA